MKKFKSYFLILLLANSFFAQAQEIPEISYDFKIETSEPYPVVDGEKYYLAVENHMVSVKRQKNEIVMQKFSTSGTLKELDRQTYADMPDNYSIEDVLQIGTSFYVFYSVYDKPNTTEQLFKREFDPLELKFLGDGERIIAVEGKLTGSPFGSISNGYGFGFSFGVVDKFDIMKSFDGSKIIIQYRKKPEVKNDSKSFDIIGMVLYDNSMKELWNREITMPYTEKKMNNLDFSLDSQGNGYVLALVYNDESTKRFIKGVINYHIELIKIDGNTGKVSTTPIDLDNKNINSIALYENGQSYMTCVGFYANGKIAESAEGIFAFKLDSDGNISDEITHEIPVSVLNQYVKAKKAAKNVKKEDAGKDVDFDNLVMRDLVFMEDGSIVVTAEQHYVVEHRDSKTGRVYYTYYYNDILISKISPNGELAWMQKLGKRQKGSAGRGGMSFEHVYANNHHYLFFFDNINNLELATDEVPKLHMDGAGGFLTAYKVNDESGKVSKVSILDTREVKLKPSDPKGIPIYQVTPKKVLKLSPNEFVLESYIKKKRDMFIKMTIE